MASDAFPKIVWDELPLSELTSANVTYGVVQPGAQVSDGVPMIRVNNFGKHSLHLSDVMRISHEVERKYERTRINTGDVLITVVGSVGQVAIVPPELAGWNIARAVALIRPRSPAHTRWIAHFLRSPIAQHRMGIAANTTVQTTVNLKDLRAMNVPMPPEPIRRGISELLSALDDRIDLLRQTNTSLEAIAQTLFKSWLVDFDPVHAKAEGREPEAMDAATAALFPSQFEESELGLIPNGWRAGRLGELCQNIRSQAKPEALDSSTPYIGLEHMPRGSIALYDAGTADGLASGKFWYARNDVLFGKLRPYFHKVGVASHAGVCSTDILVIRANERSWFGYTTMQLSSDAIIAYATRLSNGAKMPRSSWNDIASYKVTIPGEELAAVFDGLVRSFVEKVHLNVEASISLANLRDTLLPRLISGKLRLPEAEAAIESALDA
jgi:type I restriction enzyme S subunit